MTPPDLHADCLDLSTFSEDERRVLRALAARVTGGRATYGPLTLSTDRRIFRREASAELVDAMFYIVADDLRNGDPS